jgi:hypothetical protein
MRKEAGIGRHFLGQRGPEEAVGDQYLIDFAQTIQGQTTQTASNRIADN